MSPGAPSGRLSEALAEAEAALQEIWRTADGEPPKVRASTMNLVALAGASVAPEWLDTFDALASTHPARTLVFSVDPRLPPWAMETGVHAICRKDEGGVVCSERVNVRLGAAALKRARSVADALSVPELPTAVVMLPGAPALLLEDIALDADRCIVDSRSAPFGHVAKLSALARGYLADMGFSYTFLWRDLTARFFDDPRFVPLLGTLSRVAIEHVRAADDTTPAAVRLYVGWLASRLGWALESSGHARSASGPVAIDVTSKESGSVALGSLTKVTLSGMLDGGEARIEVAHVEGDGGLLWSIARGTETIERNHRVGRRDEFTLLRRAIDAMEPDRVLRDAIAAAAGWHAGVVAAPPADYRSSF